MNFLKNILKYYKLFKDAKSTLELYRKTKFKLIELKSRHNEYFLLNPKEYDNETIKSAPQGRYRCFYSSGVYVGEKDGAWSRHGDIPLWSILHNVETYEKKKQSFKMPVKYFGPLKGL